MKNILLTGAYNYTNSQINEIAQLGFKITYIQNERSKLNIDLSSFEIVVCNGLFLDNDIRDFKNLQLIQLTSAGLDRVPLDYIKKNNITLLNASGIYSVPIAEWVILKILEIYKKSKIFMIQQEKRQWIKQRDLEELTGKNIAILGFGSIGQEIAKRLIPFNVHIFSVDILEKNTFLQNTFIHIDNFRVEVTNMDIIILTLPLTDSTKHFIDKDLLLKMKNKSLLINVSRGEIISTKDLISVLKRRQDITASLDVFDEEPLSIDSALWELSNIHLSPHNSYVSNMVNLRLFDLIYSNLKKHCKKE